MNLLMRAATAALALLSFSALAQSPQAGVPLKLIVPFTPGTGIDIVARTVGPKLGQRLNRPVVVENRAGASGNIGTEAVVRAPADGNTLLVSVNTLVMNKALYPHLPFDPVKDLASLIRAVAGMVPPGGQGIKPERNAIQSLVAVIDEGAPRIALFHNTPARFDGRPELAEQLTAELTAVHRSGRIVGPG